MKILISLSNVKLSEVERETLSYLMHDKSHVFVKGKRSDGMESVFKKLGVKTKLTLYRGVGALELKSMLAGEPINYYTSFSEDPSVAKRFGKVVTIHGAPLAFNYWRYAVSDLESIKSDNADEYDSIDGDFLRETLEDEREWVMPFGNVYAVENADKLVFKIRA